MVRDPITIYLFCDKFNDILFKKFVLTLLSFFGGWSRIHGGLESAYLKTLAQC